MHQKLVLIDIPDGSTGLMKVNSLPLNPVDQPAADGSRHRLLRVYTIYDPGQASGQASGQAELISYPISLYGSCKLTSIVAIASVHASF